MVNSKGKKKPLTEAQFKKAALKVAERDVVGSLLKRIEGLEAELERANELLKQERTSILDRAISADVAKLRNDLFALEDRFAQGIIDSLRQSFRLTWLGQLLFKRLR